MSCGQMYGQRKCARSCCRRRIFRGRLYSLLLFGIFAGVLPADYDFAAHRELAPMQPGDVPLTFADASALERDYGFRPSVGIREGLRRFVEWFRDYRSAGR